MELRVDPDICQGHARCAVFAPQLISLDDDGRARVVVPHPTGDQEAAARAAEQACPERAITLVGEGA